MKYVEGKTGKMACAQLSEGEDLLAGIRQLAEKANIASGAFICIGTLKKVSFYFYSPKPKPTEIEEPLEIISCSGSISKTDGKTMPHGHIEVADSKYHCYGGHLLEGTIVDRMAFIAIIEMAGADMAALR